MANKTLIVNCDAHAQWEKNEEGEKVLRNYRRGDKVSVTSAFSEKLLALQVGGRPLFVQSPEDMEVPDNTEGLRSDDAQGPDVNLASAAKTETRPTATITTPTTRGK